MKKFSLVLIPILLLTVLSFTSCKKNIYDPDYVYDGVALVGKWREDNYEDKFYKVYEFGADGKASYKCFIYGMEDEMYTVNTDYRVTDNNKIVMSNDEGIFAENYFSVNSDGKLVISDGKNDISVLVRYDLTYNDDIDVITGEWICTDEGIDWILILNGDGTAVNKMSGVSVKMKYSVKDGTLYMIPDEIFVEFTSEQMMSVKYNKEGNVLKLTVDDGSIRTFEKA